MGRRFVLFSSVGLCCILSAAAIQQQEYDFRVDRSFNQDGIQITGVGACEISPSTVACWNMDGEPDALLTGQVKAYAEDSNRYFNFSYRMKNRYLLVTRSTQQGNISIRPASNSSGQTSSFLRQNGEETVMLGVAVPDSQKVGDVMADAYQLPGPPPVTVAFKEGAEADYSGIHFHVGPWKTWKPSSQTPAFNPYGQPLTGPQWSVTLGQERTRGPGPLAPNITFEVLDKEGKPIHYVDRKGQPVSDVKVLSETTPSSVPQFGNQGLNAAYPQAMFFASGISNAGASLMLTNVNPAQIGSLRISGWRQLRILIQGFPLDPK